MTTSRNIEVRLETAEIIKENSANVLKFGINTPLREGDKGELVLLEPDQTLHDAVAKVCEIWGFTNPEKFALKFNDAPYFYVTENNRKELSGKLLMMNYSPFEVTKQIIEKMQNQPQLEQGLQELAETSSDPTLVNVFVNNDGLQVLVNLLENDKIERDRGIGNALQALLDIMLHSEKGSWDKIQPPLISRVAAYVNNIQRSAVEDRLALKQALQVLENIVTSGNGYDQVDKETTLQILIKHLENRDSKVQQNTLSLFNALLSKAEHGKRKHLTNALQKKYREVIYQHVIKKPGEMRPTEINHELYVMQTLLLNTLDEKKNTTIDPQDNDALNRIKELCIIAFDSEVGFIQSSSLNDLNSVIGKKEKTTFNYAKLGFEDNINPLTNFCVPPGILALDCMYYLAKSTPEVYNKLILESAYTSAYRGSSGDECPYAKSSITLVTLLCDILRIGEPPSDHQGKFYPFFFQHDNPFGEMYIICSQLVYKTWKEMRATSEDFDKVFDVVREQIRRALDQVPESFDGFQKLLNTLSYMEIINLRAQERSSREEGELQAKPIQELRKKIEPEIIELIRQERLNHLIKGARFNKYSYKGIRDKGKFWFCRLSHNLKVFHYGDCDEKANPLPDELPSKVSVVDIKDLLTGKDCPNLKESKSKKSNIATSFSILTDSNTNMTLDFVASDNRTFDVWTDGINALLGNPMVSKTAQKDMDILMHLEIKLRLMNLEGIEIPQEPPVIPPPPPNYDFSRLNLSVS